MDFLYDSTMPGAASVTGILVSTPPGGDYSFLLEQRGDVDTPPASPF